MMPPGDPADKPAFLDKQRAEAIGYVGAEDTIPKFDHELRIDEPEAPSAGIISRYREIARLHALGKTNNQICEILGYTAAWMSTILKDPFIKAEVERYRQQLFDQDVTDKIKEASKDGASFIHNVILDGQEKSQTRLDAAKWVVEKAHGKARQEVSVESGTLMSFMELMNQMRSRGEVVDVGPKVLPESAAATAPDAVQKADPFDSWLDDNLP